jgi:hypothetical protein
MSQPEKYDLVVQYPFGGGALLEPHASKCFRLRGTRPRTTV